MTTEAEVRKLAEEQGWTLDKKGKVYRLLDANGTVVGGDWNKPDDGYFGLSLADVAEALDVEG
jgi:hypothetical protein